MKYTFIKQLILNENLVFRWYFINISISYNADLCTEKRPLKHNRGQVKNPNAACTEKQILS